MSTIRANTITDSSGAGAPTLPNGAKIASITDASGGNTATINGLLPIAAADVAPNVAAIVPGNVGSFLFGYVGTTSAIAYGTTVPGSQIRAGSLTPGGADSDAIARSGTWMVLGYQAGTGRYTLMQRIA